MTTQHTPGPWTTKKDDHRAPAVHVVGRGEIIARVYSHDALAEPKAAEANARLIAAAPELLAVAEATVAELTRLIVAFAPALTRIGVGDALAEVLRRNVVVVNKARDQ